jgi:hypothetical protein
VKNDIAPPDEGWEVAEAGPPPDLEWELGVSRCLSDYDHVVPHADEFLSEDAAYLFDAADAGRENVGGEKYLHDWAARVFCKLSRR